jgi:hypothetical protein
MDPYRLAEGESEWKLKQTPESQELSTNRMPTGSESKREKK